MKSFASPKFWELYQALPSEVRALADKNYQLWLTNSRHPALHFKPIVGDLWSARVGLHHRAADRFLDDDAFLWIWIGTHAEYDKL